MIFLSVEEAAYHHKRFGRRIFPLVFVLILCLSAGTLLHAQTRLIALPENPLPGEPVTLGLATRRSGSFRAVLLNSRGQRLTGAVFFDLALQDKNGQPVKAALLAVPSTAAAGSALIRVEGDGERIAEIPVTIGSRKFVFEEIVLDQENTDLRILSDPKKTAESETLWGIISRTGTELFAPGPFVPPVASTRRTSFFGDRRVFRYVDGSTETSIHAGVDYGIPRGTPVTACAPGRVVLARPRIVTGNSVVIEHLPGVYSLYYHLDKISVAEGSMVDARTPLGESGSTGLSTGPHLHWEIRIAGENADPDALMARSVLDKALILGKLNQ
ncbi:M23 family metallopeptidase [Treponema sp. TIM-1]|uniref:M23 family metallopeptidase n=1 Tax=Treponema sp. TIM-1 TaxID=2898417 RepID=UPI0039808ED1